MSNEIKIIDFIRLLKLVEKLYSDNLGNNPQLLSFIKKFTIILNSYKAYSTEEFLKILELNKQPNRSNNKNKKILSDIDINNLTLSDVRKLLQNPQITKEELLELGEKKLGISKGANKKLNKQQLKDLIESAIQNIETLDVIKEKASK